MHDILYGEEWLILAELGMRDAGYEPALGGGRLDHQKSITLNAFGTQRQVIGAPDLPTTFHGLAKA